MPHCPNCREPLRTQSNPAGIHYVCSRCAGRAVTIGQLRRVAGDAFVSHLKLRFSTPLPVSQEVCPFCEQPMESFAMDNGLQELAACRKCDVVWFRAGPYGSIPPSSIAASDNAAVLEGEDCPPGGSLVTPPLTTNPWKFLAAAFGLPVEDDSQLLRRIPWVTWGIALFVTATSLLAFSNMKGAVGRFGFVPAELWRHGGATMITCFFLHAGLVHLIGNMYFWLVFADNVEEYLGRGRFLALVIFSTIAASLLHLIADPNSPIPCIGASGGIAGVIAFYALQFPRARLGVVVLPRFISGEERPFWLTFPAWAGFMIWLTLQCLLAARQLQGTSSISAFAHFGGVLMGVILWLCWRTGVKRWL
jgi:membrane associated rhomboid family serine protease/Zn-finger nucleic acid-binding protein